MNKQRGKTALITPGSSELTSRYGDKILGVASPTSIDELRELVLAAGSQNFKLHIHGFGLSGQRSFENVVIVDLKGMDKIVEVNTKSACALLEPGVSYRQLYRYLQDNKTGLWIDCDRNSLNSVASSIAAHEFGYTPYGDHMMMQCGTEVMLTNGELTRIGMGAIPGANTWQLAKYAYGPYVDGLFTQSDLGIITKIGLWLMPAPPAYKPFMLSLKGQDDIAPAVEILRDLKINVIVPNSVVISNALLDAAPYSKREDYLVDGAVDIDKIRKEKELGAWNLYGALYNTPDNVDVLWPMVSGALSSIEGSTLYTKDDRNGDPIWSQREGLMQGIPASGINALEDWQGAYRCEIGISCPPSGEEILQLNGLASAIIKKYGLDDLSEVVAGWRSLVKRNYFLFDEETKGDTEKCVNELVAAAHAQGFGLSHSHVTHPDFHIQENTSAGMSVLQGRLKAALDPQTVLI